MKFIVIIMLLFVPFFNSLFAGEEDIPLPSKLEKDITVKDLQDNTEILFFGESDKNIFNILVTAKSRLIKSICTRELSKRGRASIKLLELKIAKESLSEERNLAAEILLFIDNKKAKRLACEYYASQLANPDFVFHNYYHYPSTTLLGGAVEEDIIIDNKTFKLFMAPAGASIPLLQLKEIALPYLIDVLNEKVSPNIIASLHAYWLIEEISKKKLPPFSKVWQNADILKKMNSENPLKELTEPVSEQ